MIEAGVKSIGTHFPLELITEWEDNFDDINDAIHDALSFCDALSLKSEP